ncbi:cAMP-dependent protein kinase catalytic subunit 2-like isoform X3 [Drosophila obscura]|uniref:cAMP-dependent protein kinase catalytic subunit 2-like isoform X3 n=1 Tax=Drosophila obscura TaxID=7282 RepID=UPI000BA15FBF|nr:cAMP-dependent protein kinase catalytic subunit 2-like isoform X3 [Drosophila obscura]
MRKFNEKQSRFYASQVVLALEYMHRMNLMYRDLKPENILLDVKGYIKLTDFGFTKRVEGRTTTLCGTPEYLAPEIIQLKPYNKCVDWWAFGILLFEFVSGRSPFAAHNRDVILMYSKICLGEYRIPNYFTAHLKNMVEGLMQVDTSKRKLNGGCGGHQDPSVVPGRRLVRGAQPGGAAALCAHRLQHRGSLALRSLRGQGQAQVPDQSPSRAVHGFLGSVVDVPFVVKFYHV